MTKDPKTGLVEDLRILQSCLFHRMDCPLLQGYDPRESWDRVVGAAIICPVTLVARCVRGPRCPSERPLAQSCCLSPAIRPCSGKHQEAIPRSRADSIPRHPTHYLKPLPPKLPNRLPPDGDCTRRFLLLPELLPRPSGKVLFS